MRWTLLSPVAMAVVAVLIFVVLRVPPEHACGDPDLAPAPEVLDAYRGGLRWIADGFALVTALLILRLRPGFPTRVGLAMVAGLAIVHNIPIETVLTIHGAFALVGFFPGVAAMVVLAVLALRAAREVTSLRLLAAYQWIFLLVCIPAGVAGVFLQGNPVCLS